MPINPAKLESFQNLIDLPVVSVIKYPNGEETRLLSTTVIVKPSLETVKDVAQTDSRFAFHGKTVALKYVTINIFCFTYDNPITYNPVEFKTVFAKTLCIIPPSVET